MKILKKAAISVSEDAVKYLTVTTSISRQSKRYFYVYIRNKY